MLWIKHLKYVCSLKIMNSMCLNSEIFMLLIVLVCPVCIWIISNVDVDDSAVYYCHTWDSSAKEHVSQWFTAWQKPPHCSHSLLLSACRLCHIRYCMIYEYNQTHLHRADSNSRCFLCVRTEENLHRSLRLIEDELQRSVFRSIQKIH